jgi:hypothetical protein
MYPSPLIQIGNKEAPSTRHAQGAVAAETKGVKLCLPCGVQEFISTGSANKEVAEYSVRGFVECQHPVPCIQDGITRCIHHGPLSWRSSLAVMWSRTATPYLG